MTPADFLKLQFGVFHHFNLATFLSQDLATGSESVNTFAPTNGRIDFITVIKQDVASSAKYAILTAKHVDGFCLWPSAQTAHTIAGTTWYSSNGNQNIAQAFVTACHNAGLKAGFYFSIDDKNFKINNPSYTATSYTNFVIAQIQELAAYAPDILWFDQWQAPPGYSTVVYATVLAAIRAALPNCLVIVNNTGNTNVGTANQFDTLHGDVTGWEIDAGGMPPANNPLPGEAAGTYTTSGQWFWHSPGPSYKTSAQVVADILTANSRNANLLANFPLNQAGALDPAAVSALSGIWGLFPSLPINNGQGWRGIDGDNVFLAGSSAGPSPVYRVILDADLQQPGCHAALTNISNTFTAPQIIQQLSSDNLGAILNLQKRGALGNSQSAVLNSSFLGQIVIQGWDGSAYGVGPNLNFYATENWATGKHGCQLQLALVTTGTTNQVIHTFDNDGTVYFAGGMIFFHDGSAEFNNTLTVQQAGGGTNPEIVTTDGTIRTKIQTVTGGPNGFVGTETNHSLVIGTNNAARITISGAGNMAFFGGAAVAKPSITGALSTVTDAAAKATLTSIITALSNLGLATNSTT